MLGEVLGQFLGHALGKCGHEHAFATANPQADLLHQVVDLPTGRLDLDLGIQKARRPDQLLRAVDRNQRPLAFFVVRSASVTRAVGPPIARTGRDRAVSARISGPAEHHPNLWLVPTGGSRPEPLVPVRHPEHAG